MRAATTRFGIRVEATPPSALAQKVAAMASDSWDTLTTTGLSAAIDDTGQVNNILTYANHGVWDNSSKQAFFVGGDHNGDYMQFIRYVDATNVWEKLALPTWVPGEDSSKQGHGYCYHAIDQTNGVFFWRDVEKYTVSAQTWSDIPDGVAATRAHDAYAYMEGSGLFRFKDGRTFMLPNGVGSWNELTDPIAAYNTLEPVAVYNSNSNLVVFGGGSSPATDELWTYNGTSFNVLGSSTPFSSIQCNGDNTTYVIPNPITDHFLVLGPDNVLRDFNAITNTWSTGRSNPSNNATSHTRKLIFECQTYGCLILLQWIGTGNSEMWIYKP